MMHAFIVRPISCTVLSYMAEDSPTLALLKRKIDLTWLKNTSGRRSDLGFEAYTKAKRPNIIEFPTLNGPTPIFKRPASYANCMIS